MTKRDLFWLDVGSLLSFAGMLLGRRLALRHARLHAERVEAVIFAAPTSFPERVMTSTPHHQRISGQR